MTNEAREVAKRLTAAQRDTMLGHMVEISPDEAAELIALGLKGGPFEQHYSGTRTVWPITANGLEVRAIIQAESAER
jgi:guanyl-specific ribonuclease Sa